MDGVLPPFSEDTQPARDSEINTKVKNTMKGLIILFIFVVSYPNVVKDP